MPDTERPTPPSPVEELLSVVPRLIDRTRSQAELARSLVGMLPCVGSLISRPAVPPSTGAPATERVDVLSVLHEPDDEDEVSTAADQATDAAAAVSPATPEPVAAPAPLEGELPIQDYDSLAASQVVPRLATLGPDELDRVAAYESAHRGRRTILNRVAQLRSA